MSDDSSAKVFEDIYDSDDVARGYEIAKDIFGDEAAALMESNPELAQRIAGNLGEGRTAPFLI